MKGDFSRNTFDPARHFSRVLMQQGRVQLDADWNEQVAIQLHYLQTLAADLIGPYGGPEANCGFGLIDPSTLPQAELKRLGEIAPGEIVLGPGRYYLQGLLVENDLPTRAVVQPEDSEPGRDLTTTYLVYLEAYERHISTLEDERIAEVALGGLDTTSRAQVVWQTHVRDEPVNDRRPPTDPTAANARQEALAYWQDWQAEQRNANRGMLIARSTESGDDTSLCITPPESRYRGAENQLYRVEIHDGGSEGATFKWSRDNGAVVFAITAAQNERITLAALGRDAERSVQIGSLVEISDDGSTLRGAADPLLTVADLDPIEQVVTLSAAPAAVDGNRPEQHPLLRRWDGQGQITAEKWITLEDGVQIWFQPGASYRTGDYWLIPARTATGDVEWPSVTIAGKRQPLPQPPHGITRYVAPLCLAAVDRDGKVGSTADLRLIFAPLSRLP